MRKIYSEIHSMFYGEMSFKAKPDDLCAFVVQDVCIYHLPVSHVRRITEVFTGIPYRRGGRR